MDTVTRTARKSLKAEIAAAYFQSLRLEALRRLAAVMTLLGVEPASGAGATLLA